MNTCSIPSTKRETLFTQKKEDNNVEQEYFQKKEENFSLDPTRYGDWEKKGRAIDF